MSAAERANLHLGKLILAVPSVLRCAVMQSVVSFRPSSSLAASFAVGELRAAFVDVWMCRVNGPIPIECLRKLLEPPIPISTVDMFRKLNFLSVEGEIVAALHDLIDHLNAISCQTSRPIQRTFFPDDTVPTHTEQTLVGLQVQNLSDLVHHNIKFPTVYADPPWTYMNSASRAAAANHYSTLTLDEICAEPVDQLVAEDAHLHLWTTNAFLCDAFKVIDAWGFCFKSCLVWVKPDIGMGNYWRVSHEFLLLGVRGHLTFQDRTLPSWIHAPRTVHSRKPGLIRTLVERASPPPYLELYGREELPNSAWTVYGNQIERRPF